MPGFDLSVHHLHWLSGVHPERDHCAHGAVIVRANGRTLIDENDDNGWSVWAAALLLLRSLTRDTKVDYSRTDSQLIPCCGHSYPGGEFITCPNGVYWEVKHGDGSVQLSGFVLANTGPSETWKRIDETVELPIEMYRAVVCAFARKIEDFYDGTTKEFEPDDSMASDKDFQSIWDEIRALLDQFDSQT